MQPLPAALAGFASPEEVSSIAAEQVAVNSQCSGVQDSIQSDSIQSPKLQILRYTLGVKGGLLMAIVKFHNVSQPPDSVQKVYSAVNDHN